MPTPPGVVSNQTVLFPHAINENRQYRKTNFRHVLYADNWTWERGYNYSIYIDVLIEDISQ